MKEQVKKMATTFVIRDEYVTLGQFLKEISEIPSGGAAKWYLQDFPVYINGELEQRRGRKIYPGMIVELSSDGSRYQFSGVNQ